METSAEVKDLVAANHILHAQQVLDAFGHVSVRSATNPSRFLLSRNCASDVIAESDILEFGMNGEPSTTTHEKLYLERYIHSSIYRARPDIGAIVHSHSLSTIPFGSSRSIRLRAICHMAGYLGAQGVPVFDMRESAGDGTSLLVTSPASGDKLAQSLGAASAVLMRGHGCTVVAGTLMLAVYRAVYIEVNSRVLLNSLQLGELTYLSESECAAAVREIEPQAGRAWESWLRAIGG